MQQLFGLWQTLDARRRIVVVLATIATFGAVLGLSAMANRPSMALLYAGLDAGNAGEVIAALDQRGVVYEVRGESIFVPGVERDALRMALASEGLPSTGGVGYELLDSLSGFGTTSQMFDAAYWRAKEGELARTLAAHPSVRSVRVHISPPVTQGLRPATQASASVMVTTRGGALPPAQAKAMRHLVASAVAGLMPEDVSIVDSVAGLVPSAEDAGAPAAAGDRAVELREKVQRLLEARVGPGKAVVELAVETVTEREAITERRFDPEGRVAISTETEERTTSSNESQAGSVTVASNLPTGDATAGQGGSQSDNSETRERTNYEVSETTRELLKSPGAIRRITVAVLVDGIVTQGADGRAEWAARPDEELAALRELIASAVGFDEARSDVITIKSLPFDIPAELGETASASLVERLGLDVMQLAQAATLAVVALILGLFVVRPILSRPQAALLPPPASLAAPAPRSACARYAR